MTTATNNQTFTLFNPAPIAADDAKYVRYVPVSAGATRIETEFVSGKIQRVMVKVENARAAYVENKKAGWTSEPVALTVAPVAAVETVTALTVAEKECDLSNLSQFTGSEQFYQSISRKLIYTDGVQYLADQAGAGWLIDAIASHQPKALKNEHLAQFQVWFLRSNGKGGCTLSCYVDTGKGQKPKILQTIEYTDFPFDQFGKDGVKLYVGANGNGHTLMLPSEY